ncbi:MAG: hypothetical protein UU37_C0002G0045 [Candidatus Gottesmanbacteria bacterium GW2011_GWA2_41_12]|nr:MAG: hypothetical protein UU37_C0002G0045 [Candidatus Gottesmanbacteria bacterium GW2011_GWA2_41_12]
MVTAQSAAKDILNGRERNLLASLISGRNSTAVIRDVLTHNAARNSRLGISVEKRLTSAPQVVRQIKNHPLTQIGEEPVAIVDVLVDGKIGHSVTIVNKTGPGKVRILDTSKRFTLGGKFDGEANMRDLTRAMKENLKKRSAIRGRTQNVVIFASTPKLRRVLPDEVLQKARRILGFREREIQDLKKAKLI